MDPTSAPDLRRLHQRALQLAGAVVARVGPDDLARPTPCAGWDLRALLIHVIGQHHGFAAAIRDGTAPAAAYAGPADLDHDSLAVRWAGSVDELSAAVRAAPADQRVRLVEFGPDAVFPVDTVVGFHLLDTTVHAWDVATGLGRDFRPDDELVAATARVAAQVPGGDSRRRPGAAFGPESPDDGTDRWRAALAHLGRSVSRPTPGAPAA